MHSVSQIRERDETCLYTRGRFAQAGWRPPHCIAGIVGKAVLFDLFSGYKNIDELNLQGRIPPPLQAMNGL